MLTTTTMAKNSIRPRKVSKEEPSTKKEEGEGTSREGETLRKRSKKGNMNQ